MQRQLNVFIDNVGRTIIGIVTDRNDKWVRVHNPAVINLIPASGKFEVQLIPLFFNDLASPATKERGIHWKFPTSSITEAEDLELNSQLEEAYDRIFNPSPIIAPTIKI